jgi:hypothetical protein
MKEWADGLVNQRIGVDDDYGNLILSVGLALQQKPEEVQGLSESGQDHIVHNVAGHGSANESRSRSGMTTLKETTRSNPANVRTVRNACVTCHKR